VPAAERKADKLPSSRRTCNDLHYLLSIQERHGDAPNQINVTAAQGPLMPTTRPWGAPEQALEQTVARDHHKQSRLSINS
jgi:hypothetical protein